MVEPGAPGQKSPAKGVPKTKGVPRNRGVPPTLGVPPDRGIPKDAGPLPDSGDARLPGEPDTVLPGEPGQMDKHADNPWLPTEDTQITREEDMVRPPSRPLDDEPTSG